LKQVYNIVDLPHAQFFKEIDGILEENYRGKAMFEKLCKKYINETYMTLMIKTCVNGFMVGSLFDSILFAKDDNKAVIEYELKHKVTSESISVDLHVTDFKGKAFSLEEVKNSPMLSAALNEVLVHIMPNGIKSIDIESTIKDILAKLIQHLWKVCMDSVKRKKDISEEELGKEFVTNIGVLYVDEVFRNDYAPKEEAQLKLFKEGE
jgi:hypothetical protein